MILTTYVPELLVSTQPGVRLRPSMMHLLIRPCLTLRCRYHSVIGLKLRHTIGQKRQGTRLLSHFPCSLESRLRLNCRSPRAFPSDPLAHFAFGISTCAVGRTSQSPTVCTHGLAGGQFLGTFPFAITYHFVAMAHAVGPRARLSGLPTVLRH
ncbi:hypothetical protein FA95DRAFT_1016268 [Auriscalpium vulgare]|uniref:Uncharacterized protein n=1 Tax=Auriscalpium vulgare TaxID=40419 RepID=A0ACB8RXM9_9AGAM|nr:hypothetical protein FA95DRAFT_1016268 [Auriscalpium vulgare]